MFATRLLSGVILLILALVAVCRGGKALVFVSFLLSLQAYRELLKAILQAGEKRKRHALFVIGAVAEAVYYMVLYSGDRAFFLPGKDPASLYRLLHPPVGVMVLAFLVFLALYVLTFPKYHSSEIMGAFFCLFYSTVMLSFMYMTKNLVGGAFYVWLIFIGAWGSDTLAYCAGMLFGKHRLSPKLSPKKTVEGAVGGVLGAGLLGVLYVYFIRFYATTTLPAAGDVPAAFFGGGGAVAAVFFICAVCALVSMLGDLAASGIKRNYGIKDYANLIPGHGGVMDRFDSLIYVAPAVYYLVIVFFVR